MVDVNTIVYPSAGLGAPKDRVPGTPVDLGLPEDFEVFSADDHISLAEDIWYENFPADMRDKAPRVLQKDGGWVIGTDSESTFLPRGFIEVLNQYDPLSGSHTGDVDARLAALDDEGVTSELAFPNAILALLHWPDKEVRELCFRIYNQHLAGVQQRSGGRIWGVGLINWWDVDGVVRTLDELRTLDIRTFLLPLNPGKDDDGKPLDYASAAMADVWGAIEDSGVPIAHHIGETTPGIPSEVNTLGVGMVQSVAPFREVFAKYVLGGILDRHPTLRVGWFEGGINWVPSIVQDIEHIAASFAHLGDHALEHPVQHYWEHNMTASFMVDPLGLEMIDRIGVSRAMWSSDFPHNESTWGYTPEVLASIVGQVGPEAAQAILGDNILCNVTLSAPTAAFDVTVGELQADEELWSVAIGCMLEAHAVADALGVAFSFDDPVRYVAEFAATIPGASPSMRLDHLARRPSEVDVINGQVVALARDLGLDAPYNQALCAVLRRREATF